MCTKTACEGDPGAVTPSDFGVGRALGKGKANLQVRVDDVDPDVEVIIVNCDLAGANLLLGQPALHDIMLMANGGKPH